MKHILIIILTIILASCIGADIDKFPVYRSQYYIYNKSNHIVDISEMKRSSDSTLHIYHLPIGDSITITTRYSERLVPPFEYNDIYISFDDSIKFNCGTHDYKMCSNGGMFTPKFCNDTLTAMEYIITDEDYNMVVSILNEEL